MNANIARFARKALQRWDFLVIFNQCDKGGGKKLEE